jgi:hypothetical protein
MSAKITADSIGHGKITSFSPLIGVSWLNLVLKRPNLGKIWNTAHILFGQQSQGPKLLSRHGERTDYQGHNTHIKPGKDNLGAFLKSTSLHLVLYFLQGNAISLVMD